MGAKLYFYYSAMNAGKSATLLQSNHNYLERGMNTLLFIPELIGSSHIRSRIRAARTGSPSRCTVRCPPASAHVDGPPPKKK
ncbi:unnamed protein product, partial [Prorocentrum cordatum]